ncbi:MAG: riboflavin synthase, partial [Dehalococcoidales bacterium]|nr:riboflavin synthase [Dehalococcoidales bacterium]
ERALALGGRMGGHLVQGHIDGIGKITAIREAGEEYLVRIEASREILRYIVNKGFIAIDGISLTVVERKETDFEISLIKHTRSITTFTRRRSGDSVNLEVDIIAKYVEALAQPANKTVNAEFLREHGFLVK